MLFTDPYETKHVVDRSDSLLWTYCNQSAVNKSFVFSDSIHLMSGNYCDKCLENINNGTKILDEAKNRGNDYHDSVVPLLRDYGLVVKARTKDQNKSVDESFLNERGETD